MLLTLRKQILTPFWIWVAVLVLFIASGVVAGVIVFIKGLEVTNLSDLVPWGLWITIDLSSIGLSAGAFLLCAGVYLLGLKQFQPVARTATFVGMVGYSMALLTLLLDIGRPDRFWHAIVYWNTHSVLWEITMCITLYLTVLLLESLPLFGEASWLKARWPGLAAQLVRLHHLAPYLAVAGLFLSMLHQSSLGACYGVLKARPIWYRPGLSVLFMFSAIAAGPSLTVLVSMLAARLSKKVYVDDSLLDKIAQFVGWVLVGYLYYRFWDAFSMTYTYEPGRSEGLSFLTLGPLSFNFWIGEILLGAVIPIVLLVPKRFRSQPALRMLALALVVGGLVAYRWDVNMAGELTLLNYVPNQLNTVYTSYFPSLVELVSGAGVLAYGMLAITLGIRYLNIINHRVEAYESEHAPLPAGAAAD